MCVGGGQGHQTAPQLALRRPTVLVPAPRASGCQAWGYRPSHGPLGPSGAALTLTLR